MGRNPSEDGRKYQIQEMWALHKEISRLLLIGMKSVDIAAQLGITEATVSYTKNSELVKRRIAEMEAARDVDAIDISKQIKDLAPKAVEVLTKLMDDGLEPIQLRAAFGILDRAGYGPVQKFQGSMAVLSLKDIDEIKSRASNLNLLCDDVIDVPYNNTNDVENIKNGNDIGVQT